MQEIAPLPVPVARGLDRALFHELAACKWIADTLNLVVVGPSGVGKSWLACARGHKAARDNFSVLYQRVPRLFTDLALARGDGRYARLMRALGGVDLLILDRFVRNAHRLEVRGDPLRKKAKPPTA